MVYGLGTRSYNRSAERREMKRQAEEATAAYIAQPHPQVIVGPLCFCRSFQYAHVIERHQELMSDYDWRSWQQRQERNVWKENIY